MYEQLFIACTAFFDTNDILEFEKCLAIDGAKVNLSTEHSTISIQFKFFQFKCQVTVGYPSGLQTRVCTFVIHVYYLRKQKKIVFILKSPRD
jgi:hypothetical protein